jgi:hypothetical protein
MSNVNLRIAKVLDQTRTRIWVRPNDTLTFHNESSADLQLDWTEPNALRDALGPSTGPVTVPSRRSYTCWVQEGFTGEFKYTAQIKGASPEDPIIIVG